MPITRVDAEATVLAFESSSGSTPSFSQGGSGRFLLGASGFVNAFGGAPTMLSLKYGGSGGTDITPGASDTTFYFSNGIFRGGYVLPGPTGTTTIYGSATGGLQGVAAGVAYEEVDSVEDYVVNSGAQGDVSTFQAELEFPDCEVDDVLTAIIQVVSGNLAIDAFTEVASDGTIIVAQDDDEFVAVAVLEKVVASAGTVTVRVNVNNASEAAMAFAIHGARLAGATGPGEITITADITEANDTIASTVTSAIVATATVTEAPDVVTSTASLALAASASLADASDTVAATLTSQLIASASLADANDTLAATVVSALSLTSSITEAADTVASTASIAILVNAALTEAANTVAATAVGPGGIIITASLVEDSDTVTSTAATSISLAGALSEGADTLSATSALGVLLTASLFEQDDSAAGIVAIAIVCSAAMQEAADMLAATIRHVGSDTPVPIIVRGDIMSRTAFDLGLLAIRADGSVVVIL